MLPFPSGLFPVRPDVSSDIASPVQPTQSRWSLTSMWVCFVEAVTVQSGAGGQLRAHDRKMLRVQRCLEVFPSHLFGNTEC